MVYIVIAVVFAAALIETLVCYVIVFRSPLGGQNDFYNIPESGQYLEKREEMTEMIKSLEGMPFEQVKIKSRDGLTLAARYYGCKKGAPLAICFHGYRGTGIRDFSGGAQSCMKMGQNLLLVDQRAQGMSTGHTITFGVKEKLDCLDWISYALERFGDDTKIILYGVSMGAATVISAAGQKLPKNVSAIIADSPYSSVEGIITKVSKDMHLHYFPTLFFVKLGARLFGHFDPREGDVVAAAEKTGVPILLIHGEDDKFVPCEMSREMQMRNSGMIRLATFPKAGHALSFVTDKERYEETVKSFLAECGINI